jgi:hypothetical protein
MNVIKCNSNIRRSGEKASFYFASGFLPQKEALVL